MSRTSAYTLAVTTIIFTVVALAWWDAGAPARRQHRASVRAAHAPPPVLRSRFVYEMPIEQSPAGYSPFLGYSDGDGGIPLGGAETNAIFEELLDRVCRPLARERCEARWICSCVTEIPHASIQRCASTMSSS